MSEFLDDIRKKVIFLDRATRQPIDPEVIFGNELKGYFEFTHKQELMSFILAANSSSNTVLAHLIKIKKANNQITKTVRMIAKELEIGPTTVSRVFKELKNRGLLRKQQNGVYVLNPAVCCRGGNTQRTAAKEWENAQ